MLSSTSAGNSKARTCEEVASTARKDELKLEFGRAEYPHEATAAPDAEKPKQPYYTRPPRAVRGHTAAWLKKVKAMRIKSCHTEI